MMGFANTVIGGAAALVRAAIRSPNYVTGTTGWSINKDGSAEFNNLVVRGTFDGIDYVINSAGIFMYSGAPASGNLMISLAQAAGTDTFGNAYVKGLSFGLATDNAQVQLTPSTGGQAAKVQFPVNSLSLSNTPNIAAGIAGGGQYADLILSGPALATAGELDWCQVVAFSNLAGAGTAELDLRYVDNGQTAHIYAFLSASGLTITTGTITGVDPSTGTSNTNPAVAETWHQLGNYPSGTTTRARYRMTAEAELEIDINLTGTPTAGAASFPNTMPAAYRPAVTKRLIIVQGGTLGICTVNTTGIVGLSIGAGGSATADVSGRVALT